MLLIYVCTSIEILKFWFTHHYFIVFLGGLYAHNGYLRNSFWLSFTLIFFGIFWNFINFKWVGTLFNWSFRYHIFLYVIVVLEVLLLLEYLELIKLGLIAVGRRVNLIIRAILLRIIIWWKKLSIKFLHIHFILLLRVLFKCTNINPFFLRLGLLSSNSSNSIWILQRFFWETLRGLVDLVLLLFLLNYYSIFISIIWCENLHLSSARSCIREIWNSIDSHCACFLKVIQNFLLRLRINTSWLWIKSSSYSESGFLFFQAIDGILSTYFLIFIFPLHLIHIKDIKIISCRLPSFYTHQSLVVSMVISN